MSCGSHHAVRLKKLHQDHMHQVSSQILGNHNMLARGQHVLVGTKTAPETIYNAHACRSHNGMQVWAAEA